MAAQELSVVVYWSPSAKQEGFKGNALSLTADNKVGKFDVLPGHTNFISLIYNKLSIDKADKSTLKYEFKRGVIEVSDNLVKVFLGI